MGYFGRFILGYGILPTPLTKPQYFILFLFACNILKSNLFQLIYAKPIRHLSNVTLVFFHKFAN